MKTPILSISGSDSTGQSGIQADLRTITALGAYAVTAVTCIAPIHASPPVGRFSLPSDVVLGQVASIIGTIHPKAIKVGLVSDVETIRSLRNEIIACSRIVIAPGIFDADGKQMIDDAAVDAIARFLVPEATLLMLRCKDAEKMLDTTIQTDEDMLKAARRLNEMGAEWVLLRGGRHTKGRVTALLSPLPRPLPRGGEPRGWKPSTPGEGSEGGCFFTSYNTDGWLRHGVAGALSAAITARLGMGDDVPTAIRNAHDFIHSQVVYASDSGEKNRRAIDLYNAFVSLVAGHYRMAHDVSFYAEKLCITTRYLSQVTDRIVGKTPKQIIADYLMSEAKSFLATTRLSVQEIADRMGFSSQALFCRFFRNQAGTSPSEYRRQL